MTDKRVTSVITTYQQHITAKPNVPSTTQGDLHSSPMVLQISSLFYSCSVNTTLASSFSGKLGQLSLAQVWFGQVRLRLFRLGQIRFRYVRSRLFRLGQGTLSYVSLLYIRLRFIFLSFCYISLRLVWFPFAYQHYVSLSFIMLSYVRGNSRHVQVFSLFTQTPHLPSSLFINLHITASFLLSLQTSPLP